MAKAMMCDRRIGLQEADASDVLAGSALLQCLRAGDPAAFEELFNTFFPDLHRFAHGLLGEAADADDAVQDVFFRLWRNRKDLSTEGSIRAFLFAGVRNRALDILRHRRVKYQWITDEGRTTPGEFGEERAGLQVSSGFGDRSGEIPDPRSEADPAATAELHEAARRAIEVLPERCRAAFLLCRGQQMTYAEAAAVLQVSPATVKTQMARALAAIRTALQPFLSLLLAVSSLIR